MLLALYKNYVVVFGSAPRRVDNRYFMGSCYVVISFCVHYEIYNVLEGGERKLSSVNLSFILPAVLLRCKTEVDVAKLH